MKKKPPAGSEKATAATFTEASQLERLEETLEQIGFLMPIPALKEDGWNLESQEVQALMEKIQAVGTPLGEYVKGRFYRGVLTGLNEAFVIDTATRKKLIAEDPKSAELIKPWLRGRDIRKWKTEWAKLYVIFTRRGINIEKYPAIKRHLTQFKKDLEPRRIENEETDLKGLKPEQLEKEKRGRKPGSYEWYEIQDNIAYYKEFERPKIIYPNITKTNIFAFDSTGLLTNQKCFIIPVDDLYLLAILNSKIATRWFLSTLPLLRGGFFEPSSIFMQQFPVFPATERQKVPIIKLVQTILADPDNPYVPQLEAEINRGVYELYNLTPNEIDLIKNVK